MVLQGPTRAGWLGASFARALAFQRETLQLIADEVTPVPEGWVMRTPSLPLVWALNQARVGRPIEAAEAIALVDRHFGELPYRQLVIEQDASGARLEGELAGQGWRVDCELTMQLARDADREVDTSAVVDVPPADVLELMTRWMREGSAHDPSAQEERELARCWQLEWRARNARLLGIRGRSGRVAAIALLYSDGPVAQVEDVYTVPEERGRGFARALVSRATRLAADARHELTFIVADDRGWPKELYGRLGFAPVGRIWSFHR
jgi:GNAT superfamily N-acetyltransferase